MVELARRPEVQEHDVVQHQVERRDALAVRIHDDNQV